MTRQRDDVIDHEIWAGSAALSSRRARVLTLELGPSCTGSGSSLTRGNHEQDDEEAYDPEAVGADQAEGRRRHQAGLVSAAVAVHGQKNKSQKSVAAAKPSQYADESFTVSAPAR